MKLIRFLIQSLLAAGFLVTNQREAIPITPVTPKIEPLADPPMIDVLRLEHQYDLAGHRSHSSHSSHRSGGGGSGHGSHQSHRSSSSPAVPYTPPSSSPSEPSRNYQSTPPSSILPKSPSTAPKTLPGNSQKFSEIVKKVQAALYLKGYNTGDINGIIGIQTKVSIAKFQQDSNLPVTGTITTEVLDALGIAAK